MDQVRILLELETRLWERMLQLNPWLRERVIHELEPTVDDPDTEDTFFWDEEPVETCPPFE